MKVSLISFTGKDAPNEEWAAADLLIFTKNTRLTMSPGMLKSISDWPVEKKLEELYYMANTIPSSWEFCDYVFLFEDVTRAFTHQFVRTRTNTFAQQTMRVLDVSEGPGWNYLAGPSLQANQPALDLYQATMEQIDDTYRAMIEMGVKVEDARGILPTNICTNIVCKTNLRTLAETIHKRSSPRTQGEYRASLESMKTLVLEVHPWAKMFFDQDNHKAAKDLDTLIEALPETPERTLMLKLVDQLRRSQ